MNPRILKKLSKRVVLLGLFDRHSLDVQGYGREDSEYRTRGASKKLSHRELEYWRKDRKDHLPMGDIYTLKGTYWVTWGNGGFDGDDYYSAVAWAAAEMQTLEEIKDSHLDWDGFDEVKDSWPQWKGGTPPKLPRSTPALIRAIERHAAEQKRKEEERRLKWQGALARSAA
ncbi:hypothetical protein [Pseudomonas sp. B1-22]|uniref:hypothetical protein n=1 Tax=Pseudomonas sp. B1-22 TaxID=3141456 RepID=UPI003D2C3DBB